MLTFQSCHLAATASACLTKAHMAAIWREHAKASLTGTAPAALKVARFMAAMNAARRLEVNP